MFTRTCHICGKTFQSLAYNSRYCSRECKLEIKRRRIKSSRGPSKTLHRICVWCGAPFETKVYNKKYCSQECNHLATAERKRTKRATLQKKTGIKLSEGLFLGLCSVCGSDDVLVLDCPECGYLSCGNCHDKLGICSVCSGEQMVLPL